MTFEDLHLLEPLAKAVAREGYTDPTPIQEQAIPQLLEGKDLIGIAQTGTGKTAAFVLPLLQKLILEKGKTLKGRPKALILAPTRELAAQINESLLTYGTFTAIRTTVIYGGVGQHPQVKALAKGIDVLVATPGRLLDLMDQGYINLDYVKTFILDEADRMLDMGFVKEIRKLQPLLGKERQTIMFSATMSPEIKKLSKDFLTNPVHIKLAEEGSVMDRIEQELYFVERVKKLPLLMSLMEKELDHVLVFTRTKAAADKVARHLVKGGIPAEAIHGDKTQAQRTKVLQRFQKGRIVLVATDVAARGIDVDDISHVINYDLPNEPENYVHRIGRTARAGKKGIAYSFCDETEKEYLKAVEHVIKGKIPIVNHPFHSDMAQQSTQKPPARGGFGGGRNNNRTPGKDFRRRGKDTNRTQGRDRKERSPRKGFGRGTRRSDSRKSESGENSSEKREFKKRRSRDNDRKPTRKGSRERKPARRSEASSERKPFRKPSGDRERKPFSRSNDDRPRERKPFVKKEGGQGSSNTTPFMKRSREERSGAKKPFVKKDGASGAKPFIRKTGGDRNSARKGPRRPTEGMVGIKPTHRSRRDDISRQKKTTRKKSNRPSRGRH